MKWLEESTELIIDSLATNFELCLLSRRDFKSKLEKNIISLVMASIWTFTRVRLCLI